MALDNAANRIELIRSFPALHKDPHFTITSDCDYTYNCIAFAMFTDVCNVAPGRTVGCWWPNDVNEGSAQSDLIDAFEAVGFTKSDNGNYEEGYDKVALYGKEGEWRHATRILEGNVEQGKFGEAWDAKHGRNVFGATTMYGEVYAYMKRPVENRHQTADAITEATPTINVSSINWKLM